MVSLLIQITVWFCAQTARRFAENARRRVSVERHRHAGHRDDDPEDESDHERLPKAASNELRRRDGHDHQRAHEQDTDDPHRHHDLSALSTATADALDDERNGSCTTPVMRTTSWPRI